MNRAARSITGPAHRPARWATRVQSRRLARAIRAQSRDRSWPLRARRIAAPSRGPHHDSARTPTHPTCLCRDGAPGRRVVRAGRAATARQSASRAGRSPSDGPAARRACRSRPGYSSRYSTSSCEVTADAPRAGPRRSARRGRFLLSPGNCRRSGGHGYRLLRCHVHGQYRQAPWLRQEPAAQKPGPGRVGNTIDHFVDA